MTEQSKDLIISQPINAMTVFTVVGGSQSVIDRVKEEIAKHPVDISTAEGRKRCASVARRIASSKVAFDDMGKELKADIQQQVNAVDTERKAIRDALDQMKDEYRKPLTAFENAEKERIAVREQRIEAIVMSGSIFLLEPSLQEIKDRIEHLKTLKEFDWQEFMMRAEAEYNTAFEALTNRHDAKEKALAEEEELIRLRKEAAEREQKEREAKIAAEAEAKAEAKAAEEKQAAEEKLVAERIAKENAEQAAKDAQARAEKADADRRAAEQKAIEDAHVAKVAAQKAAEKAAEDAAQKERDRQAAEAKRVADEQAAREADKIHRGDINRAALMAMTDIIITHIAKDGDLSGIPKIAIKAIIEGKIPNVKINY